MEYSCEEYLEEFDKGKILKYSLLQAVVLRNRLDPKRLRCISLQKNIVVSFLAQINLLGIFTKSKRILINSSKVREMRIYAFITTTKNHHSAIIIIFD